MKADPTPIPNHAAPQENIILIGFMGVGKTTVSARLGRMLRRTVLDTDQIIAERLQASIPEIFERRGEPFFRAAEHMLLSELKRESGSVISCGGGIILRSDNRRLLRSMGTVILLTATPETICARVSQRTDLPLLCENRTLSHIQSMLKNRERFYRACADLTISTDQKSVARICAQILALLNRRDAEAKAAHGNPHFP